MRKLVVFGMSLAFVLAPAALEGQSDLIGDKDCFGTLGACADGSTVVYTTISQDAGDPVWQDTWLLTSTTQTWSHVVAPGSYSSASLVFRTLGIGDVAGPYDVFVDSVAVGQIPLDGFGHNLVETFTFAVDPLALLDGVAMVSFTPSAGDGWAIDYSELVYTSSVPEPASILLMASGFLGLVGVRVRRRS